MPAFYYIEAENSPSYVPQNPERTIYGGRNPISVYYREFSTRTAMDRWLRRQSWEERHAWRPWMSLERNRRLFARHSSLLRSQNASLELQPSLFVS